MDSFWSALLPATGLRRFESLIRPLAIKSIPVERACLADIDPLCLFLEEFFGSGPTLKPVLNPSKEIILFVKEKGSIVASIRYKYAGLFENQPIHIIDCFCVHPSKRKSGLATKLLGTLHEYTNERQLRYSLFLKEGRALPSHVPLYSSHYVFRPCLARGHLKNSLSPRQANALVAAYRQLYPDTLWIYDIDNANQQWFFWKEELEWILICIQDAYQTHKGGRIGWVSACFGSEVLRSDPFERLLEQAAYSWIWMDAKWLPKSSTGWFVDGPFHWYAYQWSTNLSIKQFYGIIV